MTTDGFLYPNAEIETAGESWIGKGFPESYDMEKLLRFMNDIEAGKAVVKGTDILTSSV